MDRTNERRGRRLVAALAILVAAAACGLAAIESSAEPAPDKARPAKPESAGPRLAVVVVVDGLGWDRLSAYQDVYRGGIKRIAAEGTVFTDCRYRHVPTETAPGHASISTGTVPSAHGIVGNDWYELDVRNERMRDVYCVGGPSGRRKQASPESLKVETLGDVLTESSRGSRVVAVSGKDRSAVLLAGHDRRHAAYWYDRKSGTFVTSSYYDASSRAGVAVGSVVAEFNEGFSADAFRRLNGSTWRRLPPPEAPPAHPPATGIGEFQIPALGAGFDHDLASARGGFSTGVLRSPFVDALTADLAMALLEDGELGLGRGDAPDLLMLSFSGFDYVAHDYGSESEEAFDTLRRLDRLLGALLADLERRFGKAVVVALTSDHGFSPLPELIDRATTKGRLGRFGLHDLVAAVNRDAVRRLCLEADARPVLVFESNGVYYDRARFPLTARETEDCKPPRPSVGPEEIDEVARRTLDVEFGAWIDTVVPARAPTATVGDESLAAWVGASRYAGRSPDLLLFTRYGALPDRWNGRGTSHGSHHDYDTHVPLVFWGGGWGARSVADEVTPYDLAPTLAAVLGLGLDEATGRALGAR